jgi:hypothetical protein
MAAATGVLTLTIAGQALAQQPTSSEQQDRMLAYAQCVRNNGFAEFPDPGADGRLMLKLDESSAPRFMAAQQACRDKAPPGLFSPAQRPDPAQMERLLGLAHCMRDKGVSEFPDPDPQGEFDFTGLNLDPSSPLTRAAMDACVKAGGGMGAIGGVRIRRTGP